MRRRAWQSLLLAIILPMCLPLRAGPAARSDWSYTAASRHADAAVFARATQRVAVRSGERIAESPWTLVSIEGDRIWIRATEAQSQRELLRQLKRGDPLPELPTPRDLGIEAVEVPVIEILTDEAESP